MMMMKLTLLICFMVLLQSDDGAAWRRRRHRAPPRPPPCDTTPCKWAWSGCSTTCGSGRQSAQVTRSAGRCGSCNLPATRNCPGLPTCPVCPPCMWKWSSCSTTCGSGQKKAVLNMNRDHRCPSCDLPPTTACRGLPSCPDT